jgi:hypothetical protein
MLAAINSHIDRPGERGSTREKLTRLVCKDDTGPYAVACGPHALVDQWQSAISSGARRDDGGRSERCQSPGSRLQVS